MVDGGVEVSYNIGVSDWVEEEFSSDALSNWIWCSGLLEFSMMVMDTTETPKANLDLSLCVVLMRFCDGCAAMIGFW